MMDRDKHTAASSKTALYGVSTVCLMAALVTLAYSNTFQAPFLFDDVHNIVENPYIKIKDLSFKALAQAATKSPTESRWLSNVSFAINYYFTGMAVPSYHIVNIIIHILCGITLYYLSLTTLTLRFCSQRYRHFREIAFFASFLWLLHPVQTNGVTYIVQRMTSLATLLFLISMLAYAKGRIQKQAGKRLALLLLSSFSGLLAIISKENAIMLPVMILGYEIFFLKQYSAKHFNKNIIFTGLALFLFSAVIVVMFYFDGGNPFASILPGGYGGRDFTLSERLLTQPRVILHYLSLLFWPAPGRLNLNYDFLISKGLLVPPITVIAILGLLFMVAAIFLLFNRNKLLSFALFWFLGNLIIESSIIPLEIIFEHRMYLPATFVIIALISVGYELFYNKEKKLSVVLACIMVLFAFLTWQRNADWQSEVRIWSDIVAKSPNLARAHVNLGKGLVREGKFEEAENILRRAITLDPRDGNAYLNFAIVLDYQNHLDQALLYSDKALEAGNANPAKIHQVKGLAYSKQGNLHSAILEMEKALRFEPDSAKIHVNLGIVYGRSGNRSKAEEHFRKASSLDPDNGFALQNLGIVLEKQNKLSEAVKVLEYALTKPIKDAAKIHNNLASLYLRLQKNDLALIHVQKAIEINPGHAQSYITRGRIYEAAGQNELAFLQYRNAWERGFNMVVLYNQWAERAVLNNETGRAVLYLNEALKLSPGDTVTMQNLKTVRRNN
jgi:tetratricopeptide (TPR) repeat protein